MVAEMASEDQSHHREQPMDLDDEIVPVRQDNDLITENLVEPLIEVTNNIADDATEPPPSASAQEQPQQQQLEPSHEAAPSTVAPQEASTSKSPIDLDDASDSSYHLKWIPWNSGMIPVVMQSMNGPCPLIAIMNVLLLREKVKLPNMLEQITESQLLAYIGESIMDSVPAEAQNDENILLNIEQNIHDAIEILPKLKSGLDVNIRFTGITDFEYTPECIIFDLLRIPLYHGWLSDPELTELQHAIGSQSYNQLVDNIITNKSSQDPVISTRVLLAEEFLEKTASQLTVHGLDELRSKIKDNEIGILFRNNHFLTLFKREGEIYTLVTDHGYLTEDNIIWETLDSVEGAGRFFDSNFQLSETTNRQVSELKAIDERQQQMVNDYLVALELNREETKNAANSSDSLARQLELNDLEVARKLQAEEDAYYAQMMREQQPPTANNNSQQVAIPSASNPRPTDIRNVQAPANENVTLVQTSPASSLSNPIPQGSSGQQDKIAVVAQQPGPSQPVIHKEQSSSTTQASIQHPESRAAGGSQVQTDDAQNRHNAGRNNRQKSEKGAKESNCVVH